jgi:hypothetical protein
MLHILLSDENSDMFNSVIRRYVKDPDGKNYGSLISEIYSFMGKKYRNEYVYKNTMLNKLLFKRHDYRKTSALTEIPIANSKADFVMINGKGVVYEIKTELDNLERLDTQINDYFKAFTSVVIVTYEENIEKVEKLVNKNVGLMVLTQRRALLMKREPIDEFSKLDYDTMFKILRKKEFENILMKYDNMLPKVPQFEYYSKCLELLKSMDLNLLQKEMLLQLKTRSKIEIEEYITIVPEELKFLVYFDSYKKQDYIKLKTVLQKQFGG